jgi:hypothetical protein
VTAANSAKILRKRFVSVMWAMVAPNGVAKNAAGAMMAKRV